MKQNEIIKTFDGSHSLISAHFGEMYHSKHGALQESMHVFIKNGLEVKVEKQTNINILEMGFGTGLNAWLTLTNAKASINYYAVETHPVLMETVQQLNYAKEEEKQQFLKLHESKWNEWVDVNSNFSLYKHKGQLQEIEPNVNFDLVYYDAFAPSAQPELWTEAIFEKIFGLMNKGALLTTYCAKGSVKRALKASGFTIETVPGPPGKREMTIAHKA